MHISYPEVVVSMSQEDSSGNGEGLDFSSEAAARTPIDVLIAMNAHPPLAQKLNTTLTGAHGLAMDDGAFYVGLLDGEIYKCSLDGVEKNLLAKIPGEYPVLQSMALGSGTGSGVVPSLYVTDQRSTLWCVPIAGADAFHPREAATVPGIRGVAVSPDQTFAVVGDTSGDLYRIDLQTGYKGPAFATGLDGPIAMAFPPEADPKNVYVADYSGNLWEVPLDESTDKYRLATGLDSAYGMKVVTHSDSNHGTFNIAYIACCNTDDLWRVPLMRDATIPVSKELNLAAFHFSDGGDLNSTPQFDLEGTAYITTRTGVLWRVEQVADPARPVKPVINTPRNNGNTGNRPDFSGTLARPFSAGTTIHATEGKVVIADGVKIKADGSWLFDAATPWVAGHHKVVVTARNGTQESDTVTVAFTVS